MDKKHIVKGKKGFQRIDESIRKDKKVLIRFSNDNYGTIKDYCNKNNIILTDLVRKALASYLSTGIDL